VIADRGSGSVLALAVLGAVAIVAIAALALGAALTVRQRVIGAADAAALAAADGASGAVAGEPCALARRLAEAGGAALDSCVVDGLVATVAVSARVGPVPFGARSRAGPPP
jgi:secretion/DNA translocation related TadE-like protein